MRLTFNNINSGLYYKTETCLNPFYINSFNIKHKKTASSRLKRFLKFIIFVILFHPANLQFAQRQIDQNRIRRGFLPIS